MIHDKLTKLGPRKLLALDGGGIRGIIPLEVLSQMEKELQIGLGRGEDFVLADYFDYIGGTDAGAVIATCLSLGMRVDEIRNFFIENAVIMFDKASWIKRFNYKFEDEKLAQRLQDIISIKLGESNALLGSHKIKTLLLLILRSATSNLPWPVTNNPNAKYNDAARPDGNLNLPLWQLLRASVTTPSYFPPEVVTMGSIAFQFASGRATIYNNPAFHLFMRATLDKYGLRWRVGEEQMLLVSIGTGSNPQEITNIAPDEKSLTYNAGPIPSALLLSSSSEQDFLCRVFGRCLFGDMIDREVFDLVGEVNPIVTPKLFTYLRYDADLSTGSLAGLGLPYINPENILSTDSVDHIPELIEVGQAIARNVNIMHFDKFLG